VFQTFANLHVNSIGIANNKTERRQKIMIFCRDRLSQKKITIAGIIITIERDIK